MTDRSVLTKKGWKKVRGVNRYRDPKTGAEFALSHAIIVQEGRDSERVRETNLKKQLRKMKEIKRLQDFDPHCERLDELFPPGSTYKKKRTRA